MARRDGIAGPREDAAAPDAILAQRDDGKAPALGELPGPRFGHGLDHAADIDHVERALVFQALRNPPLDGNGPVEPEVPLGPDCTRCGLCVDACPTGSLSFEVKGLSKLL